MLYQNTVIKSSDRSGNDEWIVSLRWVPPARSSTWYFPGGLKLGALLLQKQRAAAVSGLGAGRGL